MRPTRHHHPHLRQTFHRLYLCRHPYHLSCHPCPCQNPFQSLWSLYHYLPCLLESLFVPCHPCYCYSHNPGENPGMALGRRHQSRHTNSHCLHAHHNPCLRCHDNLQQHLVADHRHNSPDRSSDHQHRCCLFVSMASARHNCLGCSPRCCRIGQRLCPGPADRTACTGPADHTACIGWESPYSTSGPPASLPGRHTHRTGSAASAEA
mmetsp:Transcript_144023/g.264711  ORF Transcript_144023/g.264711 Transcript_144023/m.264711 type:complete len:207 (+) Transcript_144023:146-766(+)